MGDTSREGKGEVFGSRQQGGEDEWGPKDDPTGRAGH